jgi:hypothetical protein
MQVLSYREEQKRPTCCERHYRIVVAATLFVVISMSTTTYLSDSMGNHQDRHSSPDPRHPSILHLHPARPSSPVTLLHSILRLENAPPWSSLQHHLHHPATCRHDLCHHGQPIRSYRPRISNHSFYLHGIQNLQSRPVCTSDSSRTRHLTHRQYRRRLRHHHNRHHCRPSASVSPTPPMYP